VQLPSATDTGGNTVIPSSKLMAVDGKSSPTFSDSSSPFSPIRLRLIATMIVPRLDDHNIIHIIKSLIKVSNHISSAVLDAIAYTGTCISW